MRTLSDSLPKSCPTTVSTGSSGKSPLGRSTSDADDGTDGPRDTLRYISASRVNETITARPMRAKTRPIPPRKVTACLLDASQCTSEAAPRCPATSVSPRAVPSAPTPVTERHRSAVVISFGFSHLYNGAPLAFRVRMRTVALLLAVLGCAPLPATAQETDAPEGALIESATVSGISLDQLSPGLRSDISALEGTPLDRAKAAALATRIEEEQPEMVAAVRRSNRRTGTCLAPHACSESAFPL